jgi:hypothetical protein
MGRLQVTQLQHQVLRQRLESAALRFLGVRKNAFLKEVKLLLMYNGVNVTVQAKMGIPGKMYRIFKKIAVPSLPAQSVGESYLHYLTEDVLLQELESAQIVRAEPVSTVSKLTKPQESEERRTNHFGAVVKTVHRRTSVTD